eukprot:167029-Pelagomonas_calceolata.AAC.1
MSAVYFFFTLGSGTKPGERMQPSSLSSSGKVETFVTGHTQIFNRINAGKAVTIIQQWGKTRYNSGPSLHPLPSLRAVLAPNSTAPSLCKLSF